MKTHTIAAVSIGALALVACETTSSRPYTASTENIMAFQSALSDTDAKVQLADFTIGEGVDGELTCRALGALEVAPGKTPVEFIEGAMRDELFTAGVYDQSSETIIRGTIEELTFSSFGTGSWNVTLNVASPSLPEGYSVGTEYGFKTSYSAIKACQNVIDAFTPAVQELIGKVVADPQFDTLAGAEVKVAATD